MSDSDMDLEIDSEEELESLRTLRRVIECDDNSLTAPPSTNSSQQSQVSQTIKNTSTYFIDLSLALNKQQDEKLQQLEKCLERRLLECREQLKKVRGQNDSGAERSESFRYINCGRPYFKDRENFAAPDNDDALIMAKNHMYDFSTITSVPGWTMRDKTELWNQIEKMTKTIKKKELLSSIAALRRDAKNKKHSEKVQIEKQISKVKKELSKLSNRTLEEIALPIDIEYDWEQITHSLDRRHSAAEYQALWKLYIHPSINKSNWSKEEHMMLQKIVQQHNFHDWEGIARNMRNNRTGYQCFVYFRTNMNNTFTGKKWSDEEVDYLLRLIEYFKEDDYIPWVKVAALMENRTKVQIYNKYTRLLEQRKGRFLPEEDTVLLTCVDDFGPDFKRVSQFLPGRSITQIRVRYQALTKKRVSIVWTVEEDRKLLQLLSNQDTTANYASIAKYFPGKDRIHIRARYVTLLKWMRRNPHADIDKAPRRGARRLGHGKASENINVAIEGLKTRIQTEANKKKGKRIYENLSEEAIEDGIVATLINEKLYQDQFEARETSDIQQPSTSTNIGETKSNMMNDSINESNLIKILLFLKAKLNKERFEKGQTNLRKSKISGNDQTCVVKVKSYSKQHTIKSIELNSQPDIWGNNTLENMDYVLPPHYATITGCKKLMCFVAARQQSGFKQDINFSTMAQRNVILREQLDKVMERFNRLFLWPLLLSNDGPNLEMKVSENATLNKEVPLNINGNVDNSDEESCEASEQSATVEMASETVDITPHNSSIEININDNKYSLTVKRH